MARWAWWPGNSLSGGDWLLSPFVAFC
jgi:hypothetical protein